MESLRVLGLRGVHPPSAPSPSLGSFCERSLDRLRDLLRLVRDYVRFYNDDRPHMALAGDAPAGRAVEGPEGGDVIALPRVGGLHHRYARAA